MLYQNPKSTQDILALYRLANNLSYKEMAKKLKMRLGRYLRYEAGCKKPSPAFVEKLSKKLDIDERLFYENRFSNEGYVEKVLKKHARYTEIIAMLEKNPEIQKAVAGFAKRRKEFRHIKLYVVMNKIIKILKHKGKTEKFLELIDFCSR